MFLMFYLFRLCSLHVQLQYAIVSTQSDAGCVCHQKLHKCIKYTDTYVYADQSATLVFYGSQSYQLFVYYMELC